MTTASAKKEIKKGFEPLPEGTYLVRMNRVEEKTTKTGKGVKLEAGFQVIDGDYKNRLIFHNFLIEHENPEAANIGGEQLDQYLKAVGVMEGRDGIGYDNSRVSEYLETPLKVNVKIQEDVGYRPRNKITKFKSRS